MHEQCHIIVAALIAVAAQVFQHVLCYGEIFRALLSVNILGKFQQSACYHTKGRAVDIPFVPGYYAFLRDNVKTTELINEGGWLHIAL